MLSKEYRSSSGRIPENASRNLSKTAHLHQAKINQMLPFATSLPHITTPDIRLKAFCIQSVLLTWEMSYWKETGGRGEEKTLSPCRQTRTESSGFAREYLSRQTTLDFLNYRMLLVLINILTCIQLSVSGFISYRRGEKMGVEGSFSCHSPKIFSLFQEYLLAA